MFDTKLLGRINEVKTASTSDDDLVIEGFANTVSKDRAGDVIPKSAWEAPGAMDNFLKNPIILAYHDHSNPIGKMVDWEVTEFGLKIKAVISKGAGRVYDLVKDGVLTTFSVGFSIKDAEYDNKTDTYFIKEVELHEVSVVSVPCNQDSVFSISKSMDSQEFEKFKIKVTPTGDQKEERMTLEEIKALAAELNQNAPKSTDIEDAISAAMAKSKAEDEAKAAKAAAAKAAKEATDAAIKSSATKAAENLVKELREELGNKDTAFADLVKANNDQIIALKEEIAQVVASKNNPTMSTMTKGIRGIQSTDETIARQADALMFVSTIKKVGMFDTQYGQTVQKLNESSSIEVSSAGYETTFATNLMRDIQAALVVAPLFTEMAMNSANLTIPINPNKQTATWVAAGEVSGDTRTAASTGAALDLALTEKTLKTFKLAAKVYLTEETEEDAIISLVPILRMHLVEAHAKSIDAAFLIGDGSGKPKGLATQAEAVAAQKVVSAAKADGTLKVSAAMLLAARRNLGLYGIDLSKIYVIISQDAYWDLIQDAEWADVQQVGQASATKLAGEVGNVYGMRVLVSNEFAARAVSTTYAVLVNTSNFVVPRQRGVTVRSDFDVESDRTVFVATQRLNLEPLIEASAGNGKGVVAVQYAAA